MTVDTGIAGAPRAREVPELLAADQPDATRMHTCPAFDGILLTGGSARRLGGIDKPGVQVGGVPIAVRAAAALRGCSRLIVVGPTYPGLFADVVTREEPPGGGPVAAVAAGLAAATDPHVVVLAADLPFIDALTVTALRRSLTPERPDAARCAAVLVDDEGHDQFLVAAWCRDVLQQAIGAGAAGTPMRAVLAAAGAVGRVRAAADQPGVRCPPVWWDCDTVEQLSRARDWAVPSLRASPTQTVGEPAQRHQRGEPR